MYPCPEAAALGPVPDEGVLPENCIQSKVSGILFVISQRVASSKSQVNTISVK